MKYAIFYLPVLLMIFTACEGMKRDTTRSFIPGMYIRSFEHEFSSGHDTLIIRHLQENTYEIVKRSGVVPVRNGKVLPVKYDSETWTGIYDEKDQVIHEQRKGKIITPVPKENKLLIGASAYQKVK